MKACVTLLKRRRSGSIGRTETLVNSDTIRLGRATDCEVFLDDLRVSLHAAQIVANAGNVIVEATGETSLMVNGQPARVATLTIGDKVSLGPYEFEVVPPTDGADIAIDYELVRPIEEGAQHIIDRSTMSLAQTALSRRTYAWAAFLIVFVTLFAIPYMQINDGFKATDNVAQNGEGVVAPMSGLPAMQAPDDKIHMAKMWSTGELSDAHKFLSTKCETCHTGNFEKIGNAVCLECHTEVENHADPLLFMSSSPQSRGCVSCHKEHHGPEGVIPQSQALCTTCHADIQAVEERSDLTNVSDFGLDHPEFRPTITIDPDEGTTEKLIVADDGTLSEQSHLKFSHAQHLRHDIFYPGTTKSLECSTCHVPEIGGQTFRPIKMKGTCDSCHKLAFDPNRPDRGLPHGDVEAARQQLKEFYQSIALEGNYEEKSIKTHGSQRRMIGQSGKSGARKSGQTPTTLAWAQEKALAAEELVFGGAVCGTCHIVNKGGTADAPEWHVQPVKLNTNFLPKANFDHSKHESVGCASCHSAATSTKSTDLLLPGIKTCRTCHAGEAATDKVPSTCTKCHDYHVGGMHPMAGHNGMMQPFGTVQ